MDIDAALEAAQQKLSGMDDSPSDGAAQDTETVADVPTTTSAADPAPSTETPEAKAERARDDEGRFAKEKKAKAEGKGPKAQPEGGVNGATAKAAPGPEGKAAGAATPPPAAPAAEPVAAVKPPQSWTPAAREAFAKAPPEVQREVAKREAEIQRTLQESAEARKMAGAVKERLAPFEGLARANGMDAVTYAGSVMQTAAVLHMGTPQQKAALVAQLISGYGIDVDAVNAVMTGQAPQAAPQPQADVGSLVQREIDRRMQAATEAKAQQAWSEFQASAPEFLDAVKDDMREIIVLEAQRGRNITYQQAYDRACKLNDEVSKVIGQREAAKAATAPKPVTAAVKVAASSVKSRPATGPAVKPKGIDAALAAAREKLGM